MKLKNLIERIKLSDTDYQNMKEKAQRFDKMMSTIQVEGIVEYEEARNAHGYVLMTFPTSKSYTVSIDIKEMLAAGGIMFDENVVKFNVTGY
jgi:hypothetical protein